MKSIVLLKGWGRCLPFLLLVTATFGRTPAITPASIRLAADYSAGQRGKSLLISRNGKIIFEQYPNGYSSGEPYKIYSGTKGFWNLAALAAEQDGILRLKDRASDTITEWQSDPTRSRITIHQLLDFTSGLDPSFQLHEDGISDRDLIALRRPMVARPGNAFIYGPCSLQVFHLILKRKLAAQGESPTHYLERRVLGPMGLGSQRYVADHSGNPLLAAGFMLTARQWSREGHVLLNDGFPVVNGAIDHFNSGTSANPAFNMGFWNNSQAGRSSAREVDVEQMLERKWPQQDWHRACLCKDAPDDLIAAIGSGQQRLYISPSQNLVVVRQGKDSPFSDATFLRLLFGGAN
jgi:CubicO group peptidase (beta-lactamase class C family)